MHVERFELSIVGRSSEERTKKVRRRHGGFEVGVLHWVPLLDASAEEE